MAKRTKKGDCYKVAAEFIIDSPPNTSFRLCHGTPLGRGPIEGQRFGHAWAELADRIVIDRSNGLSVSMSVERYYEIGHINPDEVKRYDRAETMKMIAKHETYGPWESEPND